MLTDAELTAMLNECPGERVTEEYMNSRITETKFHKLGPTLTHCTIHLDNGFQVTGESACVDPINYDQKMGEKIAYDVAFRKLWSLFGFLLAETRFRRVNHQ
jgi:hypothetical protein